MNHPLFSVVDIARLVMRAAALYQGAYDNAAADAASAAEDVRRKEFEANGNPYYGCTDYREFYRQSLASSCWLACKEHPEMATPISLLLSGCWNDVLDWAMEVTRDPCIVVPYDPEMWKDVPTLWAAMPGDPIAVKGEDDGALS